MNAELVSLVRLAVDSAMTMLIWLVQLVIYPAFRSVDPALFRDWHQRYMRTISFVVIPLMLLQGGCVGLQCLVDSRPAHAASAVGILTAWIVTFRLSVPCHRLLQTEGRRGDVISRLVHTNWIRTVSWTGVWIAGLYAMLP